MLTSILGFLGFTIFISWLGYKKFPALTAGWFWYVLALLPISGITPVGAQWTADRFTYIPHILLIAGILWTADNILDKSLLGKKARFALFPLVLIMAFMVQHNLWFWKDGITIATRSAAIAPDNVNARLLYADAVRIEDPVRSIGIYKDIIKSFPHISQTHHDLAHALWSTGRNEEAMEQLREALKLNPDYPEARLLLAESLFRMGRLEEAAMHYTSYLKIESASDSADYVHNQLGLILRKLGYHGPSADQFRQAVNLAPENGLYHFNLAVTLSGLGERADAIQHYGLALEIQPQNHMARLNLAERLFAWGEREMAAYQYNEIVRRLPNTAEEHLARGRLAEMEGNQAVAQNEYRQGLNARVIFPQVRARLERLAGEVSR